MDNGQVGEQLNQLSRLLFDAAARKWYVAVTLVVGAGILATIFNLSNISGDWALLGAAIVTLLLAISYALRLWFEALYGTAEMMRRQSVLTEALDWPVDKTQMAEWRERAGKRIRSRVRSEPRSPDYYGTEKDPGPERLAEMTIESAFYTRHLYGKLKFWVWTAFIIALAAAALAGVVALTRTTPATTDLFIGRAIFPLVPIVLSVDLLGWALRLERLMSGIRRVEEGLDRFLQAGDVQLPQVLRLVFEYNCQVTGGFPILNRLFDLWHEDIEELWQQR